MLRRKSEIELEDLFIKANEFIDLLTKQQPFTEYLRQTLVFM